MSDHQGTGHKVVRIANLGCLPGNSPTANCFEVCSRAWTGVRVVPERFRSNEGRIPFRRISMRHVNRGEIFMSSEKSEIIRSVRAPLLTAGAFVVGLAAWQHFRKVSRPSRIAPGKS